jgi:hypothetical protein
VPHAQQKTDQRYPYEMLFRSVQYALVDNACREFLFISEFFMLDTNTAQELFNNIFGKIIQLIHPYDRLLPRQDPLHLGQADRQLHHWQLWLHLCLPLYPYCPEVPAALPQEVCGWAGQVCDAVVVGVHNDEWRTLVRYWENLTGVLWPRLTNVMQMNIVSVREFDTTRRKPADVRPHYSTRR